METRVQAPFSFGTFSYDAHIINLNLSDKSLRYFFFFFVVFAPRPSFPVTTSWTRKT